MPLRAVRRHAEHERAPRIVAHTVVEGLEHPWAVAFLPDGRYLISERPGRLRVATPDGRLLAPITAVADTYDSTTSSRAYRAGSTHEAAVKEMTRVSGTQLDPRLLDVFLRICDDDPALLVKLGVRREWDDR